MNKTTLKYGLVALAGFGLSANVNAADYTCDDITFTPAAYATYQYIDKACLEIVDRDGGTFAKFTGTKVVPPDLAPGVSNFLRFQHNDGSQGARQKTSLPRNFQVYLRGSPGRNSVRLADIDEGQEINIYAGQEFWSPPVVEAVVAAVVAAPPPPPPAPEPEPEPEPEVLPTTAGSLPLVALLGSLFLLLGGALRFSRKQ
jgi:hypothetical protein